MTTLTVLFWAYFFVVIFCLLIVTAGVFWIRQMEYNSYEKWKDHLKVNDKYRLYSIKAEYLKYLKDDDDFILSQDNYGYYYMLK